ncbi:peroxisomal membrane protein PEX13 [Halyomorpha halys]|uniref:peroxisomal membrane protein PEX13 n=1 Tax=Halyomorpha halys TaxID=286706 RepID=UPI0006D5280C|nr:peroxisomal membrane protein PEX13 [Halyomorpha halys]
MANLPKPWEQLMRNHVNDSMRFSSQADLGLRHSLGRHGVPPLPPRSSGLSRHRLHRYNNLLNGLGDYGGFYSPYSSSMFRQQDYENRYIQMAEESAQPAFESIEAFIRGFSSVTMMLESTFQAMNMSFRAILGVAENVSKMRTAIIEFLSAFAILKIIYSFYRKILYFLGLVNGMEVSWKETEKTLVKGNPKKRQWPIVAFLGAIIVGPTLVYKYLLPTEVLDDEEVEIVGVYDFEAEHHGELSFAKGDKMTTKRSELKKSWLCASKASGKGYVPYNRVGVMKKKTGKSKSEEVVKEEATDI